MGLTKELQQVEAKRRRIKRKEMPALRCPWVSILVICFTLQISSCIDYDDEGMDIEIDPEQQKQYFDLLEKYKNYIIEEKRSPFSQRQQFMIQKRSPFMQRNSFMETKRSPFMQRHSFMASTKRSPFAQRLNFMGY